MRGCTLGAILRATSSIRLYVQDMAKIYKEKNSYSVTARWVPVGERYFRAKEKTHLDCQICLKRDKNRKQRKAAQKLLKRSSLRCFFSLSIESPKIC